MWKTKTEEILEKNKNYWKKNRKNWKNLCRTKNKKIKKTKNNSDKKWIHLFVCIQYFLIKVVLSGFNRTLE